MAVLLAAHLEFFNGYLVAVGVIDNNINTTKSDGKNNITNTSHAAKCNPSLWKFIANPPGRFKILNQCVTVTGVVISVQYEPDGDTDFSLALDLPYKNMVTQANFNPLMRGGIWSEMICQHPECSSIEVFKKGECIGYNGPIFRVPQTGEHILLTGTYLLDIREGGHAEIHPVSSMQLIK
jgi:hypothetical protein